MTYMISPDLDELETETELRQRAAELPWDCWGNGAYSRFTAQEPGFGEAMALLLSGLEADYLQLPILASEIAAESVVCHRLLLEAVQLWYQALNRQCNQSAEQGSRLLAAVIHFSNRLQREH